MEPKCWIYVIVGFGLTSWMPEKCARFTKWLIVLWLSRGMWLWLILSHLSWCVNVLGLATVITSVNLHYTMHALLASLQITWDISCNGLSCPSSYYIVWWQIYSLYGLTGKQWRQLPQPQLQLLHPWPGVHQEDETGGVTVMGHHTRCWATVADSAGKGKASEAPPPPLYAWYLLGPHWGGAQDNEPYGGISIKTQKSEYEKIRIFNAWSIEKCATPKR